MTNKQREEFERKVDAGIKVAIAEAIEEHRRMGRSISIWRDGKVVTIPPEEIPLLRDETKANVMQDQKTST
jgi:hypothetical protein